MTQVKSDRSIGIWIISIIAIVFGSLTIKSGGSVLFIDGTFRADAGKYVPFVVWFNFLAGFIYLVAGFSLWMQKQWATWLAISIAAATLVVFALFGIHVLYGGLYEIRTIAAMSLRTVVWASIATFTYRKTIRH